MCDSPGLPNKLPPNERSLREAASSSFPVRQSPSSNRRQVTYLEARVCNGLSSVNARQGHERQEADVLVDHAGRAVAHASSNRPRMEAVAESPDPLVRAIEDADGPGAAGLRRSGKIGACSLAGVAIIPTSPATARVVGPKHGARTAALVNVAITFGALLAPPPLIQRSGAAAIAVKRIEVEWPSVISSRLMVPAMLIFVLLQLAMAV